MKPKFIQSLGDAIQQYLRKEGLLARRSGGEDLESAWREAAGETTAARTRLCTLKRGVLRVEVEGAPLLHELESFRKAALTDAMRRLCPKSGIREIRFLVRSK